MAEATIDRADVRVLDIPTATQPESDGTASWSSTMMVLVEVGTRDATGLGYSYIHGAAASIVADLLAPCIVGGSPFAIPRLHGRMVRAVRNQGRAGIAACAIAAVDIALWDLAARTLELPLSDLFGRCRDDVPVYASGGFTSTPLDELADEVAGWATCRADTAA